MHVDSTTRFELRCWRCKRLQAIFSIFQGQFERRCKACHAYVVWTGDPVLDQSTSESHTRRGRGWLPTSKTNAMCDACRTLLAFADVRSGAVEVQCKRCKRLTVFRPPVATALTLSAADIMAMVEERWETFVRERVRRRAEMAVGLRFEVFKRDGFRCRYCGRSAMDGVLLHADHVVPESKGGPTTLENLVTACIDCNLGKSNKDIDPSLVIR